MGWVTTHHPTVEELNACVQCGLCLPVCPTFRLTGRETASPRGRLHAMSAVGQEVVELDDKFAEIIDFCLGCRACEPICPGLVPYGRTLEGARAEIDAQLPSRGRRNRVTLGALGSRRLMRLGGWATLVAQTLGLTAMAPPRYRRVTRGLRRLAGRGRSPLGEAAGAGDRGTVGLLTGCVQDEWFRAVNRAAFRLLQKAGYMVVAPEAQTCCGALAAHDGKADLAETLMRRNDQALSGYDLVVATAAGCSAHLAGYEWAGHAPLTEDVTVTIARAIEDGVLPRAESFRGDIAIQDPCHLRHAQRVIAEPRSVLAAAGYTVLETDPDGFCCGAAGLYTILQPDASAALGAQKADQVRATGATRVASANPGCEMQIRAHLGAGYDIRHPIEWYLEALEAEGKV